MAKKAAKKKATKAAKTAAKQPEQAAAPKRPSKPAGLVLALSRLQRGTIRAFGPGAESVLYQATQRGFEAVSQGKADHVFALGVKSAAGYDGDATKSVTVCLPGGQRTHRDAVRKALGKGVRYIGQIGDCAAFQLIK